MKWTTCLIFLICCSNAFAQLDLQLESSDNHFRDRKNPADHEYFRQKNLDYIRGINLNSLLPEHFPDSNDQCILLLTSETCKACPLMKSAFDSIQVLYPKIRLLEFTNKVVTDSSFYTEGRFIGSQPTLYDTLEGFSYPAVYFIKNARVVDKSPRGGVSDPTNIPAKVQELNVYIKKYFID